MHEGADDQNGRQEYRRAAQAFANAHAQPSLAMEGAALFSIPPAVALSGES
jgi:hypothetical protein